MQSPSELVVPLALTFGGCCSNVFTLESVLKQAPNAASFLTFIQFVFVAAQTLPTQITFNKTTKRIGRDGEAVVEESKGWIPRLKTRKVPLKRWAVQVVLFLAVSWLNNYAFSFNIPVPVHIIFRSGGLAVSMLTNYLLKGRRYPPLQVVAVLLVSAGVILATLSAPPRHPKSSSSFKDSSLSDETLFLGLDLRYIFGILLLSMALFLSGLMGIWQEGTYAVYGNVWQEGLFYSHFLSLPLFFPLFPSLPSIIASLNATPPLQISLAPFIPTSLLSTASSFSATTSFFEPAWLLNKFGMDLVLNFPVPAVWVALAINVFTQAICVGGVNRLTAKVSSLTTSLILTFRKAVSLVLSVWWFSGFDEVGWGLVIGGGLVLLGTALYSVTSSAPKKAERVKDSSKIALESKKDR